MDPLRWGLIPYWCMDPAGGRKPINAKCETVRDLPTFRDAYRKRRGIVPVDGFFEWRAIKGQKAKQPYAIAMKDGAPFGIAGIWENWKVFGCAYRKPRPFDLVKESRNVDHDGRVALLLFKAVGFAVQVDQPA